jgi:hypothetical protein
MSYICANGKHRHSLRLFRLADIRVDRRFQFSIFHLQIFHWFIALPWRRYFQGHSPLDNPTPLP